MMHDGWHEQERRKQDRKAWVQLGLALVGAGAVFGSLIGGLFGMARVAAGALDIEDGQ